MKHVHYDEVEAQPVAHEGARGARVRWLIAEDDGAPNFCMRRFELEPGGCTPRHAHEWEHEVYILEGDGTFYCEGQERAFRAGDVVFVALQEEHSFTAGEGGCAFLCLIPRQAHSDSLSRLSQS